MANTSTAVSYQRVTRRGLFRRMAGARTVEAVRPPGALTERRFQDACTGCGDCAAACPTGVIVMASGIPEIDFARGGCEFCGACTDACRSGAIRHATDIAPGPAWTHRVEIGAGCLSGSGVVCRVCGEQCEAGAIRFRHSVGGRSTPELDPDLCNGCGACVGPCPAVAVAVTFAARGGDTPDAHGTL